MQTFLINIKTGKLREIIASTEESNDPVTAVNMACNRLTQEQRNQIIDISVYRGGKS